MSNEQPPEQKKNNTLLFALILIPVVIGFCVYINENVLNTPLTRQFDDAARQAQIAACESEKGYKNTEDCYK
ncbi:hypothetical protein [Nostoc sp. FACHB-110]|uniref:hypothetical protein n=1 Tax=Nostoc sp. FACHB-110 TaxID=2692834 RepID=UPI001687D4CA|nr:hypothetical protein [Nostoc sp. FACHB-110]MBD2437395.1 hypothetical protein [Nostoc sp. FACHB-110]